MSDWFVYIVRCCDDSLYTGITKDVERRIQEHNDDDSLGAKYTKARRPVVLVHQEKCESRSAATRREIEIKKLSRKDKNILLSQEKLKNL
jgi:putative endonuclease